VEYRNSLGDETGTAMFGKGFSLTKASEPSPVASQIAQNPKMAAALEFAGIGLSAFNTVGGIVQGAQRLREARLNLQAQKENAQAQIAALELQKAIRLIELDLANKGLDPYGNRSSGEGANGNTGLLIGGGAAALALLMMNK